MRRFSVLFALLALCLVPALVSADISPNIPTTRFETSASKQIYLGSSDIDMDIIAFHQSSQNWILYFEHSQSDIYPYDNLTLSIDCNDQLVSVDTTDYSDWVDDGVLSITFPYAEDDYPITYNEVSMTASRSECELSISDYGASSYVNNTQNYTFIYVEMIPILAVLEFVNCSSVDTAEIQIMTELDTVVAVFSDFWEIAWLVYSLCIIIFAVFMIPIFIFILIRWALFRLTGYKLVERRDRGSIS